MTYHVSKAVDMLRFDEAVSTALFAMTAVEDRQLRGALLTS